MRKPIIALLHGLFTQRGSISLPRLFEHFESALQRDFETRSLPDDYLERTPDERRACLRELFAQCDAAMLYGVVRYPYLLDVYASRPRPDFPILYHPVGELPRGGLLYRSVFPHFESRDSVLVTCRGDLGILQRITASSRAAVRQLPYGIETNLFRPRDPAERARVRERLGYGPGDFVMLFAGRLTAEKNVHGALSVFQEVARRHTNARLCVIGPMQDDEFREFGTGPHDLQARFREQLAQTPELAARVQFLEPVPLCELAELYAGADLLLNLTLNHDENFCYITVDAMSAGLPVVGTFWGGQQDTIADGETGFHVPVWLTETGFRVDEWRAVMACCALLESPSLRAVMGAAGRARVQQHFSRARFTEGLCAAVHECFSREVTPGVENRFSAFGNRFHRRFSRPARADERALGAPACLGDAPYYDGETYPLYQRWIAPYGSPPQGSALAPDDVLWLRSRFMTIADDSVDVDDPLWPSGSELADPAAALLLRHLQQHRFVRLGELLRRCAPRAHRSPAKLRMLLRELLRDGLVGRSPAPARLSPDAERVAALAWC